MHSHGRDLRTFSRFASFAVEPHLEAALTQVNEHPMRRGALRLEAARTKARVFPRFTSVDFRNDGDNVPHMGATDAAPAPTENLESKLGIRVDQFAQFVSIGGDTGKPGNDGEVLVKIMRADIESISHVRVAGYGIAAWTERRGKS